MRKTTFIFYIIIAIILIALGLYWFLSKNSPETVKQINETISGFSPFNRSTVSPVEINSTTTDIIDITSSTTPTTLKLPKLRQLSDTPVGGMQASSTKENALIRFIDRGVGHISEATDKDAMIEKISNTTLPKIYESYWNKDANKLVLRYLRDNTDSITNFYAEIRPVASTTASSTTPFEIKGKYLSADIKEIAVSPIGDKIFTWNIENGNGVGYTSSFDEKNKVKVIESPLTQINIDWPENNTVTITNKGTAAAYGYSYSVNLKDGKMSKIVGGLRGLSLKMSRDTKKALYSVGGSKISTKILNTKDNSSDDVIFRTIADKCIWSSLRKNEVYCAVPTEIPTATYPDDWYKGKIQFVDQIWHLDTETGEVHLLANLLTLSNKLIDAVDLALDPKEDYLYFINKRDLTLWSLDLNQ